jgi:hypothetical protein
MQIRLDNLAKRWYDVVKGGLKDGKKEVDDFSDGRDYQVA